MESVGSELSKSPSVTDRANLDSFNFSVLGLHVGDQINNKVGVAHLIVIPAKNIWMVKKYFRWKRNARNAYHETSFTKVLFS